MSFIQTSIILLLLFLSPRYDVGDFLQLAGKKTAQQLQDNAELIGKKQTKRAKRFVVSINFEKFDNRSPRQLLFKCYVDQVSNFRFNSS